MLAEIFEFLNKFRQQGVSGGDQSVYKCREFLGQLVENFLTDTDKICESLKKDAANSEYMSPLQFCGIFLRDKSEVFLTPPPSQCPNTPSLSSHAQGTGQVDINNEDSLTHSYCWWYMQRVLVLLGQEKCAALHQRIRDTVHQILQAVKWRDAFFYGQLLRELVLTLTDLVRVSVEMFDESIEGAVISRFTPNMDNVILSLQDPSKRKEGVQVHMLNPAVFNIDDIDVCELLQVNLTRILHAVGRDVHMFCLESQAHSLWVSICLQLQNGDVLMKTESLWLLGVLLDESCVPMEVEDYFLDCLTEMLKLLLTGLDKVKDLHAEDHIRLEKSAASVYQGLVRSGTPLPSVSPTVWPGLLYKLATVLETHGLAKIRTRHLREVISALICRILTELSPQVQLSLAFKSPRNQLIAALVSEIGFNKNLQFLVKPLVSAVMCDLGACQSREVKDTERSEVNRAGDGTPKSVGKLSLKRKLEPVSGVPIHRLQTVSSTYKVLLVKLNQFLQHSPSEGDSLLILDGVQVIMEIISSCVLAVNLEKRCVSHDQRQASSWLSAEQVGSVCGLMYRVLQHLSTADISADVVSPCHQAMLHICGALLSIHDYTEYVSETYQTFGWIASLPWLMNDPTWIDLKPEKSLEIGKMCVSLVPGLTPDSSIHALPVLALLPKDVAHKWRVHVFRQALGDSEVGLKLAALQSFPLLLHNLGPNANHLVYDLIHPCLSDTALHTTLVHIAGPLACVVSRKTVTKRPSDVGLRLHMYRKITVACLSCDCATLQDVSGSPKERPKLVDPNMFLPFIQLVDSESTDVKMELARSMRLVFGHIGVRKNNTATINILNLALKLIEDPVYDVRVAFSEVIQYLLGDGGSVEGAASTNELALTKLRAAFYTAQKHSNARLQETVLLTIAQLGRISDGELLVVVIIVLLESMLSPTPLVAAVAYEQMKTLAEHKNTKTEKLFMRFRHDVCKFLVDAMHNAQTGQTEQTAETILIEVSQVLGFPDVKAFLTGTEKYLVPFLVSKGTQAASQLIKMIATKLGVVSRSKLLMNNTKFVFSYLVRFKQKESDLQNAIHYLQKETNFELQALLRLDFQRVHNELLIHLSTHYTQVFHGLKILATYENKDSPITSPQEMATYLQPRILGVLAHFDSLLLNATYPMEEKRAALESLISIIRLMGSKIISGIRHKVMNMLRIQPDIKDKQFTEISCRAWNCFVRSLELPFLGQMLPQIVATLLPLLQQLPKQVAEIFNYMIVENRNALKSHFHDIYFLPDIPELKEANTVLKPYTDEPTREPNFPSQLEHTLRGIQHDSLDVRLHALSKLKKLLTDQRKALSQLVMEGEAASPLVSKLISLLLKGCREPNERAQRLYAECLGHCGAIDPSRLELSTNNPKVEVANFIDSIQREKFALALITEVVKSYLAATEPRIQDCSAYALQELLSIYNIAEDGPDEHGRKLWSKFSVKDQEILIPFLTSKYILANQNPNWQHLQKPIYGTRKGNSFKDWVSTWTAYLSSKVKPRSKAYRVFEACSAVIKFDNHIGLFILPYVVLHVLQDGTADDKQEVFSEIMEVLQQTTHKDGRQKGLTNFNHMSSQTVFSVLDYLTKWKYLSAQFKSADAHRGGSSTDPSYMVVGEFLDRIPQDKLAEVSFSCKAYTRSLMHYEQYLKGKPQLSKEESDFMQRLYVELDEPDGVQGVAAMRQAPPSLQEQILTYSGRLGCQVELQGCYEQAIQGEPDCLAHHQGLLRCLMDLSQPSKALHHATGVIARRQGWAPQLLSYQVEAAWKLSQWKDLENYVKVDKTNRSWSLTLGRILLAAKSKKTEEFLYQLQCARHDLVGPLSAASMEMGSYQRGYEHIVRLHILTEVEECVQVLMGLSPRDQQEAGTMTREDLVAHWQTRFKMMQSSFRIQESVLTMRRTLMNLVQQETGCDFDREIGQSWLCSSKTAQKTGYLQTASQFLLQASEFNMPEYGLQKAKWHWEKDEKEHALSLLKQQMEVHFSNMTQLKGDNSPDVVARRKVYAKALLLYGRYSEEASNLESNAIVKQYKEVIDIAPDWEHGYFYLGKYFDKIMTALVDDKDDMSKLGEFVVQVVKNLGNSLRHGSTFIYQSLPRLLSLWLDFGTSVVEQEKRDRSKSSQSLQKNRNNLAKLNNCIEQFGKSLAAYQLFFSFSQLVSRICHAHNDVFQQLQTIIARLVVNFPQQALWLLMGASKSSYLMRAKRCQEIFATAIDMKPELQKVILDHTKLTERLLELCERDLPTGKPVTMSQYFKPLKRLMEDSQFSRVLLPRTSSMTVTLPSSSNPAQKHDPFPADLVYISGFDDNIEVLNSLQKPKKITMKGSDGGLYVMMCKPKDDLRKDCRLMEFNGIVNKFLRKDPESRKRFLYIRTYTVVPLNEECGLVEWVNNTTGLRYLLIRLYKEKGLYTSGQELKAMQPALQASDEVKLKAYKEKMLPRHPPVFGEWFLRTFPDPTSWYNARLAYCKTIAVMSMVGYILGLGDRHGENILFDSTSGDCVHVDFNCLFNRGKTFEWPEKVPFRLTHNLVHAMGPLKLEGIYRRACEVTLRVMRKESEPLMSVLKPFVYDPLVEWSKMSRGQRQAPSTSTGEQYNEQGRVHVQNIEQRLQGIMNKGNKRSGLALSVEGQVHCLIEEATSERNLSQMYIGWAAYM